MQCIVKLFPGTRCLNKLKATSEHQNNLKGRFEAFRGSQARAPGHSCKWRLGSQSFANMHPEIVPKLPPSPPEK